MPARCAVSSTLEAAISAVPGNAPSAWRAYWRWAERSPRLLPSATYTRSRAAGSTSALDGEVGHDALEVGGHVAQLPDGALEVDLPRRRLGRAPGQHLGVAPGAGGTDRHLLDLSGEPADRLELLGGGAGDGAGVLPGLAGGSDDGLQRHGRVRAQLLHSGHRIPSALHLGRDRRDLPGDLLQQPPGLTGSVQA